MSKKCLKCGMEFDRECQECPKCGGELKELGNINENSSLDLVNKNLKKNKLKKIILLVIFVLFIAVIPGLLKKPVDYMNDGDYQKAYQISKDEVEKNEIVTESKFAYVAKLYKDKSNKSATLINNAYYYDFTQNDGTYVEIIVFEESSLNPNYVCYEKDGDADEWHFFFELDDLSTSNIYWFDNADTTADKMVQIFKVKLINMAKDNGGLDQEALTRIKDLWSNEKLNDVQVVEN